MQEKVSLFPYRFTLTMEYDGGMYRYPSTIWASDFEDAFMALAYDAWSLDEGDPISSTGKLDVRAYFRSGSRKGYPAFA